MIKNEIICGDCLEVMKDWPDNSVDAIVTDIPYGIGFMGKEWDTFKKDYLHKHRVADRKRKPRTDGRNVPGWGNGADAGTYDHSRNAEYQEWCRIWSAEALRIAKPGAFLLCFGGTRTYHRVTCGLEDAGWQIRDCMMFLYGSGFPKSCSISQQFDRTACREQLEKELGRKPTKEELKKAWKGFREVVGQDKSKYRRDNDNNNTYSAHCGQTGTITAPATDLAKLWDGYGTAMKPAWEPILLCQKPLTIVPSYGIIKKTQNLLGALLCQLLLNANSVVKISKFSPSVSGEVCASALMLAAMLRGSKSEELLEKMGMSSSRETASTCLSIAKLWSNILAAVFSHGNMFTTEKEAGLIIGLRTLNCLLSENIPVGVIKVASHLVGDKSNVMAAKKSSNEEKRNTKDTQKPFAPVLALLNQSVTGTNARNVKKSLQLITPSVNSVLLSVLQSITTEKETSLVPNWEPIIVAMKPLDGTFAANAEKHGVAGLNIDGSRIGTEERKTTWMSPNSKDAFNRDDNWEPKSGETVCQGRWPANLILDEEAAADAGEWKRYFYCAKASRSERTCNGKIECGHPTIKPLKLMQYLCRLLKPPQGGVLLDPFCGSGTTLMAAVNEGWDYIGIDREQEYVEIAEKRIAWTKEQLKGQGGLFECG